MQTINKTTMSDHLIMADTTLLRGVSRINIDNPTTSLNGFVFDKALQFPKTPLMNPLIISCGSPNIADVFHHDNASIRNAINYSLTYIMVSPSHKLSPSTTQSFEVSLGRFCAFGLKFANQSFMLNPKTFDLLSKEHLGRCYCELVYSDIDAKNSILDVRASDIDIFGECEQEEASTLFINFEQAFSNIPREVLFVAIRNGERYFYSALDGAYAQNVVFEACTSREVVSHRTSAHDGLGFSLLDHSTSLLNTSNSKLALQTISTQFFIDKRMELDVIPYFIFPSNINAELQSLAINFESSNYLRSCDNLDFSCRPDIHKDRKEQEVFKTIGGWQFLSTLKSGVSLPNAL
jgi:hypothetical protein